MSWESFSPPLALALFLYTGRQAVLREVVFVTGMGWSVMRLEGA